MDCFNFLNDSLSKKSLRVLISHYFEGVTKSLTVATFTMHWSTLGFNGELERIIHPVILSKFSFVHFQESNTSSFKKITAI